MSDLLNDARTLRQRLYRLEVLLEIEREERGHAWFAGGHAEDVERAAALKRLLDAGLIETAPAPLLYRLAPHGRDFLRDVRSKVSAGRGELDWGRADEIDFSRL